MLDWLLELQQWRHIIDANQAAGRGQREAREGRGHTEDLAARLDALSLASIAMWEILHEKLGVTEQELMDRMREIDLRDGKQDGRLRPEPRACSSCARPVSARHRRCMYCGNDMEAAGGLDAAR